MATFTANQIAAFATNSFQVVDCIEIDFYDFTSEAYDATVYLTTKANDLTIGGTTYIGGLFKTLNAVPDDAEINRRTITISLSGLSLMLVQSIQENNFVNAPIRFKKVIYDNSGDQVDDPITTYIGNIETAKYVTSGSNSDVSFSVSHNLYNFTRRQAVHTNNTSFKKWAHDLGYTANNEFVGIDLVQEYPWGRG